MFAQTTPRYEFRVFAVSLLRAKELLESLGTCQRTDDSDELYVVSRNTDSVNVKIRGGMLDVKRLVARAHGLEQWQPGPKHALPLPADVCRDELFAVLGIQPPALVRAEYDLPRLVGELIEPCSGLAAVRVHKRRHRFTIGSCLCEYDHIDIDGHRLESIALESTNADAVNALRNRLGLGGEDNVNYVSAVKKAIGMEMASA